MAAKNNTTGVEGIDETATNKTHSSDTSRVKVNRESVSLEEGEPVVFILESLPIEIERKDPITGKMTSSWACQIKSPVTGEALRLWCPAMLASMLTEEGERAIGHKFEAIRQPKVKGKRYALIDLYRLD